MPTPTDRLLAAAAVSQRQPRIPSRARGRPRLARSPLLVLPVRPPATPTLPLTRRDLEAQAAQLRRELATVTRHLDHVTAALAALPH